MSDRNAYTLADLAAHAHAEVRGNGARPITGLGSLESAGPLQISHLSSVAYARYLEKTSAGAVILRAADLPRWHGDALVTDNPYLAFARISQLFVRTPTLAAGVHPTAVVAADAVIDASAAVGPGAVVGARARIAARVAIHANSVVGADCVLATGVCLMPGVVLYHDVALGERTIVHGGAVIGADGFGFTPDERGRLETIAQLGGVRIGADVSIGANTTIDRGAIDHTVIGDGVKIDNQVQIGHNVRIGEHTVICGCVGIVGSTKIGRHVVLAGGVGVGGDGPIEICDSVVVSGMTHVSASITEPGIYSGGVLHSRSRTWKRNALRLLHLDELFRRVAALERRQRERG